MVAVIRITAKVNARLVGVVILAVAPLRKGKDKMTQYKTLQEAIDSIGFGMCSICEAEHEFPDVKCDLMYGEGEG